MKKKRRIKKNIKKKVIANTKAHVRLLKHKKERIKKVITNMKAHVKHL